MKTKLYKKSVTSFTTYFSYACHNNDIKRYKGIFEWRPPIVVVSNSVHRVQSSSVFPPGTIYVHDEFNRARAQNASHNKRSLCRQICSDDCGDTLISGQAHRDLFRRETLGCKYTETSKYINLVWDDDPMLKLGNCALLGYKRGA